MKGKALCILSEVFYPGYKAGGPARSCMNIALSLEANTSIYVLCSNSDLKEKNAYVDIRYDQWVSSVSEFKVNYCSPQRQGLYSFWHTLHSLNADVLYLNSLFSTVYTVLPLLYFRLGLLRSSVVLAPRGMLKPSALKLKSRKKKIFLGIFKLLNIHKLVSFHATSEEEAEDIHRVFGDGVKLNIVPPLPELSLLKKRIRINKDPQFARFCFLGRVHPIKNLHLLLLLFQEMQDASTVVLDIIGPEEDANYFLYCQKLASAMPDNVKVNFWGETSPEAAIEILQQAHFLALLSAGENFGHAIFEALALGKPVLISDQTPWVNLQDSNAGWEISLSDTDLQLNVLTQMIKMSSSEYLEYSDGAYNLADNFVSSVNWNEAYLNMFFGHQS